MSTSNGSKTGRVLLCFEYQRQLIYFLCCKSVDYLLIQSIRLLVYACLCRVMPGYDVLVASDAIGMGLNLNIKR